jgi:uncharacterized Zn finger protein
MSMASDYQHWPAYVPVAERRRKAEQAAARLAKKGRILSPVRIAGRAIATTFWGKAWCENLEGYRDYESRLPRGRTYARNGSVIDLQIAPLKVTALVSGSSIYTVEIAIKAMTRPAWESLCRDCAGEIASLVELLQGRFSKAVMTKLCRQDKGLFPKPADIRFSCSCPDHAVMCKHVAAVLYGVGSRLDEQPELLFRLRDVTGNDLIANLDASAPLSAGTPVSGNVLDGDDLSALFGLDMAPDGDAAAPPAPAPTPAPTPAVVSPPKAGAAASSRKPRKAAKAPAAAPLAKAPAAPLAKVPAAPPPAPLAKAPAAPPPAPPVKLTSDGFVKWWK